MVCHTVSGLKCGIRRTPPTSFRSPKKHVGGVYFTWSGEIFLRNFMPYPPKKKSRVKRGDTTMLAQSTSQYYFVLQSLHKVFPSTSLYYKACTNYFPVLVCTTKLAMHGFCLFSFNGHVYVCSWFSIVLNAFFCGNPYWVLKGGMAII